MSLPQMDRSRWKSISSLQTRKYIPQQTIYCQRSALWRVWPKNGIIQELYICSSSTRFYSWRWSLGRLHWKARAYYEKVHRHIFSSEVCAFMPTEVRHFDWISLNIAPLTWSRTRRFIFSNLMMKYQRSYVVDEGCRRASPGERFVTCGRDAKNP